MKYRKRKGEKYDAWHWRKECPQWPKSDYKTRNRKPTSGELCTICRRIDRAIQAALDAVTAEEILS